MRGLLRSLAVADAVRSLAERAPEADMFVRVLRDAMAATDGKGWALIGGLAVGFHSEPRGTQDVDLMIAGDLEEVVHGLERSGWFRRTRSHAVEHRATGVEVELLTHDFIGQPASLLVDAARDAERVSVGDFEVPVVRPRYLIALKLKRALGRDRKAMLDRADILGLLQHHGPQDLLDLPLPAEQLALYEQLKLDARSP